MVDGNKQQGSQAVSDLRFKSYDTNPKGITSDKSLTKQYFELIDVIETCSTSRQNHPLVSLAVFIRFWARMCTRIFFWTNGQSINDSIIAIKSSAAL